MTKNELEQDINKLIEYQYYPNIDRLYDDVEKYLQLLQNHGNISEYAIAKSKHIASDGTTFPSVKASIKPDLSSNIMWAVELILNNGHNNYDYAMKIIG